MYRARKTKALRKQKNVAVPLSNRFTVLASTADDNNACSDQSISRDSSGHNTDLNDGDASKRSFQQTNECKHPSSLGIPQTGLAVQANSLSHGNKNETGFFIGDKAHTKTESDNCMVTTLSDSHVTPCGTSQVVTNSSQTLALSNSPSWLKQTNFSVGIKTKLGILMGMS